MEIKLKDNEGLGYGIDDETFNLSEAKTLDEIIEQIKFDGYLEDNDKEWAYIYITRLIDSKAIIKRWLEDNFYSLNDICFDKFSTEDECDITIDDELLNMLDKKIALSVTHTGSIVGMVNINTKEFKRMKVHNLLKDPTDLPVGHGKYQESFYVNIIYREVSEEGPMFVTSTGTGFYSHEDKEWYVLYDESQNHISGMFSAGGGQRVEYARDLIESFEYPKEFVKQMTKAKQFKCEKLGRGYVFTKEIIGLFEIPSYEEFMEE